MILERVVFMELLLELFELAALPASTVPDKL
jgi:hypothetical protein